MKTKNESPQKPPPPPKTKRHLTLLKAVAWAFVLQALTTSARSAVSLKDAAFLTTAKDLTLHSTDGPPLAFKRYYSSRSHYLGWFGFGWCTDFEKKIEFLENQRLRLHDCKMSRPEDLSPTEYKKTAERIIIAQTEFDLQGRLIKIATPEITAEIQYLKNTAQITSRGQKIGTALQNSIKIKFDPNTQFVQSVTTPQKKIVYDYDGDNLVAVKENKAALSYHYDGFKNIERIDYQDKTFETIAYDSEQDRVRLFRDRKGCIEKFSFEKADSFLPRSSLQIAGLSKVERRCQGRLVAHALFKVGAPPSAMVKIERMPSNENADSGELQ